MENTTKIKICGLKRMEDIEVVNRLRPDYVGFVFAGTKRKITKELAKSLKEALVPQIRSVGVFVDEPVENIAAMCREGILDLVQLHGGESEAYIQEVKAAARKPVIAAIRVRRAGDILERAQTAADYILLDAYRQGEYGGVGECFCWEEFLKAKKILEEDGKKLPPVFLAGGLKPENVWEAVLRVQPYALDVSSGVETDGFKDENKIKALIDAVRH